MSLGIDVLRRIAFIRYLHQAGVSQSRQPAPMKSACILMLHDATESMLGILCEHYGIQAPSQFDKHWEALAGHVPGGLPVGQGMRRLNKVRVNLKHHGAHPSDGTIDQAISDTATFMTSVAQVVFGVDYDTVSMAYAIPQERVRLFAERAQAALDSQELVKGMMWLRLACDALLTPHEPGWNRFDRTSPIDLGPDADTLGSLNHLSIRTLIDALSGPKAPRRFGGSYEGDALGRNLETLKTIVGRLQDIALLNVIGMSYSEYERFRRLTPSYWDSATRGRNWKQPVGYEPAIDDFNFCLQFVVTTSLRLMEIESATSDPSWLVRDQWNRVQQEDLNFEATDGEVDLVLRRPPDEVGK